jgi:hypothetical protein
MKQENGKNRDAAQPFYVCAELGCRLRHHFGMITLRIV